MNPNNDWVLYNYGSMLKGDKNEDWQVHWKNCLQIYLARLASKSLIKQDAERALEIAKALEIIDSKKLISEYLNNLPSDDQIFNEINTVTTSGKELQQDNLIKRLKD